MARARRRSEQVANPFMASGALRLARAGAVFLIGLFVLFRALAAFGQGDQPMVLIAGFAAAVLILSGLTGFKQAIDRLTGFEPDPRSPADLVPRLRDNQPVATIGKAQRYSAGEIKELFDVGAPPEGSGRTGTLGRLAQLFLPGLRYAPPEIRLLLEYIFSCAVNTLIILGLAIFFLQAAATVGLELEGAARGLFWWVLAFVLLARWRLFVRPSTLTMRLAQMRNASPGTLQGTILFLAILAGLGTLAVQFSGSLFGLEGSDLEAFNAMFNQRITSGPPMGMVGLILALALALVVASAFFWFVRMARLNSLSGELDEDVTRIRFQRDGVGNSRHFAEAMITAMQGEGSDQTNVRVYNHGASIYAETPPVLEKAPVSKAIPFIAEAAGNGLLLIAAVVLGLQLPEFSGLTSALQAVEASGEPTEGQLFEAWQELGQLAPWALTFLIFGGFGKWFLGLSEVFLGETNFRSVLMRAQLTGTETQVTKAIGNAAFDTYKTEVSVPYTNGVVEAASVVLHTCAFARPNANGLMGPRSILEFGRDEGVLGATVQEAVRSLDQLRFIPQLQHGDRTALEESVDINTGHAQAVYHGGGPALPMGARTPALPGRRDEDES